MMDVIFYILAIVTLPLGALIVTSYAGWSLERELERSRRERLEKQARTSHV